MSYHETIDDSRAWVRQHAREYRGYYIAVRAGVLIGYARTVQGLLDEIGRDTPLVDVLITKVLQEADDEKR
jgi:hypothetical protein